MAAWVLVFLVFPLYFVFWNKVRGGKVLYHRILEVLHSHVPRIPVHVIFPLIGIQFEFDLDIDSRGFIDQFYGIYSAELLLVPTMLS